jgi:hypothetical protein
VQSTANGADGEEMLKTVAARDGKTLEAYNERVK